MVKTISSGSMAINDVAMQLADHTIPFGGVGQSGMGRYHGRSSFDTFSNRKSVLEKTTNLDLWIR